MLGVFVFATIIRSKIISLNNANAFRCVLYKHLCVQCKSCPKKSWASSKYSVRKGFPLLAP